MRRFNGKQEKNVFQLKILSTAPEILRAFEGALVNTYSKDSTILNGLKQNIFLHSPT